MRREKFGLIGEKLGHSFSPAIHAKLGDYRYLLYELRPQQLGPFLKQADFDGLNVTIPYKKAVIPYCAELTPQARRIGSVNTLVRREDGALLGHNTDYDGFRFLLKSAGAEVKGKKALILGTGGASLTVHTALEDLGAAEIVYISRSGPNHYGNLDLHSDAQIIVNATPVGMYPNTGECKVDLDLFPNLEGVFDLIYNPARTQLLLNAERKGAVTANGLGMLVAQAKAAAERFLDRPIPDETVGEIAADMEKSTRNLVLVGMPGCGKTTIGLALSNRLKRRLVDTDELIVKKAGCPIPEIFAKRGQDAFRAIEHDVICQVGKESGLVIATGGGIVTRPENFDPMRQNSTVVMLSRELSLLPTAGRPLSQSNSLDELYRVRKPLYEKAADLIVENVTIDAAVEEIVRRLGLDTFS